MLYSIFILLSIFYSINCERNYAEWSVIRVSPSTADQVSYLSSLQENDGSQLQIWRHGNEKRPFEVALSPEIKPMILEKLKELNITYEIKADSMRRALEAEKRPVPPRVRNLFGIKNVQWFSKFLKFKDIQTAISQLASRYPNLISIQNIGTTHEGRPLNVVKISSNSQSKPAIWIDGGIHAREWISPATALFMLNKLVTTYDSDPNIKRYVDSITWYAIFCQRDWSIGGTAAYEWWAF